MRGLLRPGAVSLGLLVALVATSCGEDESPAEPSLGLTCSASPTSGIAPLAVAFQVTPSAPLDLLELQYGDGTSGNNPGAGHVYQNPGSYAMSATGKRQSQSATCGVTINAAAPPAAGPNNPPTAVFLVNPLPADGPAPLRVVLNMCESTDPDGDALFFTYDWGDGSFHDGTRCVHDHNYNKQGRHQLTGCVSDRPPDRGTCQTWNVFVR